MFICNHCPYVVHVRDGLARLGRDYAGTRRRDRRDQRRTTSRTYPEDGPASLAEEAREAGYTFPYLFDETQEVAKAYPRRVHARLLPVRRRRRLVYRGQFDDSRPATACPSPGADLRGAIDAVLAGPPVADDQRPSIGCNIKWKPGNEPV